MGIAGLFKDVEPVTLAYYLHQGNIKASLMIPISLFEKIGQAVQGMSANMPAQSGQN